MEERRQPLSPTTPTQAEGERDPDAAARERGAASPARSDPSAKPSQAEGDRDTVDEDLRRRGLADAGADDAAGMEPQE